MFFRGTLIYPLPYTHVMLNSRLPECGEIKGLRKSLRLSAKELGNNVGLNRVYITKVENGDFDPPYSKAKQIFDELYDLETKRKLGDEISNIKIIDITSKKIIYIKSNKKIVDASIKMRESNFSQFPVRENRQVIGSITEDGVNRVIREKGNQIKNNPVKTIMEQPFPTIPSGTSLPIAIELLTHFKAVIVLKDKKLFGIITNSDIGKALSQTVKNA